MQYIKVEFIDGIKATGYQEIDGSGFVVRYIDEDGTPLRLPEVYECMVIDSSPDFPAWGIKDTTGPQSRYGTTQVGNKVILGDFYVRHIPLTR